jgi:hypothetical protein
MLNFRNDIIGKVVEEEMRRVIKGVLSEIYFAHIATLFMENWLTLGLRDIAQEAYLELSCGRNSSTHLEDDDKVIRHSLSFY